MKKVDYRAKTEKDLHKILEEKREALHNFRFGSSGSRTTNVKEAKNLKKEIARVLTTLNAQVKAK